MLTRSSVAVMERGQRLHEYADVKMLKLDNVEKSKDKVQAHQPLFKSRSVGGIQDNTTKRAF